MVSLSTGENSTVKAAGHADVQRERWNSEAIYLKNKNKMAMMFSNNVCKYECV